MTNYINALQNERDNLREEIVALRGGLTRLLHYVSSDKFSQDPYVNKDDIILRIREILYGDN